jgi:hypothetical protein
MNTKFTLILFAGLLILPATLAGCGTPTYSELERVQKETPFTIVLLTYIPEVMRTDYFYQVTGPFKDPVI